MSAFVKLTPKNSRSAQDFLRQSSIRNNSNLPQSLPPTAPPSTAENPQASFFDSIRSSTQFITNPVGNAISQASANRPANFNNVTGTATTQQTAPNFDNVIGIVTPTPQQLDQLRLVNAGVTFYMTPTVGESGSVSYIEISDIRMPNSVLFYSGSPSRVYSISANFFARTVEEADMVVKDIRLLRSWRMPEQSSSGAGLETNALTGKLDTTPRVLNLSGYNGMFNNIPVVVVDLSLNFPPDTDYISSSSGVMVPILSEVSCTVKEIRSLDDIKKFNIDQFRSGQLENW